MRGEQHAAATDSNKNTGAQEADRLGFQPPTLTIADGRRDFAGV
jgi:hypothetical protein